MKNLRSILAAFALGLLLLVTACAEAPSRWDQAQQESTQRNATPAVAKDATQGSSFNRFFPDPGNGYERIYTQEKKGFAEAKLKKDGKDMAMLAISDTTSTPSAAEKFKSSQKRIGGYPAVDQGSTATAVLVGDRYQVKVLSRDPAFTASDREAWLQRFDLRGLSQVQ